MKIISAAAIVFASVEGKMLKSNEEGLKLEKDAMLAGKSSASTLAGYAAEHVGDWIVHLLQGNETASKNEFVDLVPLTAQIAAIAGTEWALFFKNGFNAAPKVFFAAAAAWSYMLYTNFVQTPDATTGGSSTEKPTILQKIEADASTLFMFLAGQFVVILLAAMVLP